MACDSLPPAEMMTYKNAELLLFFHWKCFI